MDLLLGVKTCVTFAGAGTPDAATDLLSGAPRKTLAVASRPAERLKKGPNFLIAETNLYSSV
ncbi:hypothetical protein CAQU_04200 [Corynebacterium aquilae DSM 44791]|uniref:Uncharacterized protein n=1 Tax=Corynebacterium aquilae DSM 44791 TaxID=1431546 RepID=A0A1L7CF01_9CORY|nr:hypothetical protein CAQU_04200 [Corynebacterium aquilae DSM 44791]